MMCAKIGGVVGMMLVFILLAGFVQAQLQASDVKVIKPVPAERISDFTKDVTAVAVDDNLEFRAAKGFVNLAFEGYDGAEKLIPFESITEFRTSIDSSDSSRYKWSYQFRLPDEKFKAKIRITSDEPMKQIGSDYFRVGDGKLLSFDDVKLSGFQYRVMLEDEFTAVAEIWKDWVAEGVKVGDLVLIDPYISLFPSDGQLGRSVLGVFEVVLTGTVIAVGNDVGAGDSDWIYRGYWKFNTSGIDPWDTVINATFWARVNAETCGSGSSGFWLQNISDYGDLGESDWVIPYQNISLYYNTSTNASGWHSVKVGSFVTRGGFTYYRIAGTYEDYAGVDCFINIQSNESANEPYLEVYYNDVVPDAVPPNVTIYSPSNTTYYDNPAIPLQVSAADSSAITLWYYSLNGGANQTFTPNITVVAAAGPNSVTVWAKDSWNNWGMNVTYFSFIDNVPDITIYSPNNETFIYGLHIPLDVSASEPMSTWRYSVNGNPNVTFVPNATLSGYGLLQGYNQISVCANDTTGNWNCSSALFNVTIIVGNLTITLALYYPPYAVVGEQQTIHAVVMAGGVPFNSSDVDITIDGSTADMVWNSSSGTYVVYWIPSSNGVYPFNVTAIAFNLVSEAGSITVATPFTIGVRLWNSINMSAGTEYRNEFAWIYMTKDVDPTLHVLFGRNKFACPPEGTDECYWHGQYANGTAYVRLFEAGNYTMYILGNNIEWTHIMPSGVQEECAFCPPVKIQSRFLLNLGSYYFDKDEEIDLYYSNTELYYFGGFFGGYASWLNMFIFGAIGLVFFLLVLIATGSLKSAIAVLIILPSILWLLANMVLW